MESTLKDHLCEVYGYQRIIGYNFLHLYCYRKNWFGAKLPPKKKSPQFAAMQKKKEKVQIKCVSLQQMRERWYAPTEYSV